jgi:hypothetical protein
VASKADPNKPTLLSKFLRKQSDRDTPDKQQSIRTQDHVADGVAASAPASTMQYTDKRIALHKAQAETVSPYSTPHYYAQQPQPPHQAELQHLKPITNDTRHSTSTNAFNAMPPRPPSRPSIVAGSSTTAKYIYSAAPNKKPKGKLLVGKPVVPAASKQATITQFFGATALSNSNSNSNSSTTGGSTKRRAGRLSQDVVSRFFQPRSTTTATTATVSASNDSIIIELLD